MKKKNILIGLCLAAIAALVYFTVRPAEDTAANIDATAYAKQLSAERQRKNEFLRTDAQSPIPANVRGAFIGLTYFPADPRYRVEARLEPFADKTQRLTVRLTDGSEEIYEKLGHAVFSLDNTPCRLLIVRQKDAYFVLFRDKTSGKESYGGGRYIDLNAASFVDNRVLLDFNAAYNPYCAYNPDYACPIPPVENTLSVAVKAGEMYVAH
jgi:uncharacterized protein